MPDVKSGLAAVLGEARPQDVAPADEGEQLDLLGLPVTAESAALMERRGPGRPAGSRNRRTAEWADYLLAKYRSPLETLTAISAMRVDDLAAQLGCKPIEALMEIRLAAIAVGPYLHQRAPVAVDLTNHKAVSLTINLGEGAAAEEAPVTIVGIVEKQMLSEGDDGAV